MNEFLVLISQFFLIACIEWVLEVFISPADHPYLAKLVTVCCFLGALYLLLQFTYAYVMKELLNVLNYLT